MRSQLLRLVLFLSLLLALPLAPACRALGSPIEGGTGTRFVAASRAASDLWGARLQAYLAADPNLDPMTKDQLIKSVDDWELAIEAAEEAARPDSMPAPEVPR